MAAPSGPKRIVSNPTNIFVVLAWVPDVSDGVGKFNNVYRADQPNAVAPRQHDRSRLVHGGWQSYAVSACVQSSHIQHRVSHDLACAERGNS